MRRLNFIRFGFVLCMAFFSAVHARAEDVKSIHPAGYVTDLAGVISSEKKASLEAMCAELEQKTGAQLAIVTVRSLEGESVESYAVDLFKQLGLGSKKDNRGVLLVLAPIERKYHIEVGYGLEPLINDARTGDAGRAMVPALRQADYSRAVEIGAWQLAKYVADDSNVTLSGRPPAPQHHSEGNGGASLAFLLFLGVIILISIMGRFSSGGRGGGFGGGGGLLWFLLGMLANSSGGRSSGWGGGGFGGGSGGWSGGGGFGGFGGGSSGGGGASGSW
jgi:uncharacterized protein